MSGPEAAGAGDPTGESGARAIARGIELFDAGLYLEAHEEFERVWESNEGGDADFLKGLIQACVAMHHFREGNLEGAARLYTGHRRYLAAYLPRHRGIDVAGFLDSVQACLRPVVRREAGSSPAFDAERRPRIGRASG